MAQKWSNLDMIRFKSVYSSCGCEILYSPLVYNQTPSDRKYNKANANSLRFFSPEDNKVYNVNNMFEGKHDKFTCHTII